jgi:hypothetical protein
MGEESKICGWKQIRRRAMAKVHDEIKRKEAELGRELSESEYRETLRTVLREEFRKAFEECGAI